MWLTEGDDRVCEECDAMDGVIIDDNDEWDIPPGDMHNNCRCVDIYVEDVDVNLNTVNVDELAEGASIYYEPERELPVYWLAGALLLGSTRLDEDEPDHAPDEIEEDYWIME